MKPFAPFDRVIVQSDRFRGEGVVRGTIGFVLERYSDGNLEIEVCRKDGTTVALFAARPDELELAQD